MLRNVGAGLLMIAFVLVLIYAGSARAEPSLDRFQGLVCKTPEGVKAVFSLHEQQTDNSVDVLMSEIKAVNDKAGTEDCRFRNIMEEDKEVVATFHWRDSEFDVKRISVWADCNEGFCIYTRQDDGYIASMNKDTPV